MTNNQFINISPTAVAAADYSSHERTARSNIEVPAPSLTDVGIVSESVVAVLSDMVAATGMAGKLAVWRAGDHLRKSRVPVAISDHSVMVALLVLSHERASLTVLNMAELLRYRLTSSSRELLGLPILLADERGAAAERQWRQTCRRALHRLLAVVDPFPQNIGELLTDELISARLEVHDREREKKMRARLDDFTQSFLTMTFDTQPPHLRQATKKVDIAIATTMIASPIANGYTKRSLTTAGSIEPARREPCTPRAVDVFAGFPQTNEVMRAKTSQANLARRYTWGWEAAIAIRVDSTSPARERFPRLALSASIDIPSFDAMTNNAVTVMRGALATGLPAGVVDADVAYFGFGRTNELQRGRVKLGFGLSTDYRSQDLGCGRRNDDAVLVEGAAYCGDMPELLHHASVDYAAGRINDDTYQVRLAWRDAYRMRPRRKANTRGMIRLYCPVQTPDHLRDVAGQHGLAAPIDRTEHYEGTTSDNEYGGPLLWHKHGSVVHSDAFVDNRQAFAYGTTKWDTFHRHSRTVAETMNRQVHAATERGNARIPGMAAAQVMLTMTLTASNLRAISQFTCGTSTNDD